MFGTSILRGSTNDEFAAVAGPVAACLDCAAMHLNQPIGERETNAKSVLRRSFWSIGLHEQLEYFRELFPRNSLAIVRYRYRHLGTERRDGHSNASARGCVFGCVVEQIGKDLREACCIGVDDDRSVVGTTVN